MTTKNDKDKQRSTKHTHKTKDRVLRTPLQIGRELRCSGREDSSCSTSGIRRVEYETETKKNNTCSVITTIHQRSKTCF